MSVRTLSCRLTTRAGHLPDSHFTDAVDQKLANALEQVIQAAELNSKLGTSPH